MQDDDNKPDGAFLLPIYTVSQTHPRAAMVADLFAQLDLQNCRKKVFEDRYNALCTLLAGVNYHDHHRFRLSQNKNEYTIQQWPIGYRAMMFVQDAAIGKGWLIKDVGGYTKSKAGRRTTVLFAPEGSPLIVENLFRIAELAWSEPVIQVRSSFRGENGKYVSNNIDVEWHANPKNGSFVKKYIRPQMDHLNTLAQQHDYDLGHYEFTQWVRKFRGGIDWAGGRLYAKYQRANKDRERLHWLIDGEPVAEIDITACGPTMLACINDQQRLVEGIDPYQIIVDNVPRMTRKLAKKICVLAIGNDGLSQKRWPKSITKDRQFDGLRKSIEWKTVRAVVSTKLPYLLNPSAKTKLSLRLQDEESRWLMFVMKDLLENGVGCLPVHESIIVPQSQIEYTKAVMARHFQDCFGVTPLIDVEIASDEMSWSTEIAQRQAKIDELLWAMDF